MQCKLDRVSLDVERLETEKKLFEHTTEDLLDSTIRQEISLMNFDEMCGWNGK